MTHSAEERKIEYVLDGYPVILEILQGKHPLKSRVIRTNLLFVLCGTIAVLYARLAGVEFVLLMNWGISSDLLLGGGIIAILSGGINLVLRYLTSEPIKQSRENAS